MTYIVPHFRYGCLIYHNIRNGYEKKDEKKLDRMQILLNKTAKQMFDLPNNTPNDIMAKIMGNWNMKTLTINSYTRAA